MASQFDSFLEPYRQAKLTDMEALEEFIVDNSDLDQLEDNLRQFNIFEAIGMQWQEIRHSAFLAFLLDPNQPHGLGDDFLKKLLQKAFLRNSSSPHPISLDINLVGLHLMNLHDSVIERERSNIDVLVVNKTSGLSVIIENKLLSGEHSNQLVKYFEFVKREFPGYSIIPIFLSVEGKSPSHSNYLPLSYADIAELVSRLIDNRMAILGSDVLILMRHYVQMLRKNILDDTELNDLCEKIYKKHKRALDLIISRIPDKKQPILLLCKSHLEGVGGLEIVKFSKSEIAFIPEEWNVPTSK